MSAKQVAILGRRPALPPLGEILEFMRLIWALDHALQRASKRMQATLGVTGPQRLVIRIVGRFPGILLGQIAEILHIHPSTLTGVVKRLEEGGLVTRRPDPRDRRRTRLGLTATGRGLADEAEGTIEAAVRLALAQLPAIKARHTAEVLSLLAARLEHEGAETSGAARAASAPSRRRRSSDGRR
jgi:DNA-binding MarR family transcriptional regulator